MKKTVIILSVLALIASSCNQAKKQDGNGNIPADSIQVINETCLVLKWPEKQDFNEEESEALYDFIYHSSETSARFKKLGIDTVTVNNRYLSFALNSGENHIIDTKEQNIFEALLYKKGVTPIPVHIVGNDWKTVADYLQMDESEIIKQIEVSSDETENEESSDFNN